MPFYEYECSNCKFYVEAMQKISDEPLKKCPSCGEATLVRLISAPVFRLKGGGWYETDFKGDKESKRNLSGGDSSEGDSKASKDRLTKTKADKPKVGPKADKPVSKAKKPASRASKAKKPATKAKPQLKSKASAPRKPAPKTKAPARKAVKKSAARTAGPKTKGRKPAKKKSARRGR